jgi:pimeloyl-ACP methyl ester carboxylesterase
MHLSRCIVLDVNIETRCLPVTGAELHVEVRGTGPVLLIAQSGDGNANRSDDLADALVDTFTVVTYDRRGQSRSPLTDPSAPVSPAAHGEDLHHVLAAVTSEPAHLLGCSLGALYGLHLAKEHPEQVAVLIAHDPATPALLPSVERQRVQQVFDDINVTYTREGMKPALAACAAATGIDLTRMPTEQGIRQFPMDATRTANIAYFLTNDLPQMARSDFDAADVTALRTRVIPAAGVTSDAAWNHSCMQELARLLDEPIIQFPGGHNGNLTHPRAFAAQLRATLAAENASGRLTG